MHQNETDLATMQIKVFNWNASLLFSFLFFSHCSYVMHWEESEHLWKEMKWTPAPTDKHDFHLFLENLFIYSFTVFRSCFQFTLISCLFYPCFGCLSTCRPFASLRDSFEINSRDWFKWTLLNTTSLFVGCCCCFLICYREETNVLGVPHSPLYSPGSVSAQTAKPHEPRSDRMPLTATLAQEFATLQWSEKQRAESILGITGAGGRVGKGVDMKWKRKKRKGEGRDEEDSTEEVISLSRFCILLPRHVCSCQHQEEGESTGLAFRHKRMNDSFWFFSSFPLPHPPLPLYYWRITGKWVKSGSSSVTDTTTPKKIK